MTPDRLAVVACGAIARDLALVIAEHDWPVEVVPLPPLLHNHPERIADAVRSQVAALRPRYSRIAVGYADCGTFGALDQVCAELGLARLHGHHCYDVFAGEKRLASLLDDQPGTYLLTDFLARGFHRLVVQELGLDRYPELRDDYFGNYTRVLWLAQDRDLDVEAAARAASVLVGLPLEIVPVGRAGLADQLRAFLADSP